MILLLESENKFLSAKVFSKSQCKEKEATTIDTVDSFLNEKQHENKVLVTEQEHQQGQYYGNNMSSEEKLLAKKKFYK